MFEYLGNFTTFPFSCIYFCYNILLKNAQKTGFRIFSVLSTKFRNFVQDKSFIKCFWFWILLVVLENIYLEEMVEKGFTNFCILEKNPFVLIFFAHDLVNGLHLRSKDQVIFINHMNYLTCQSWLLLIKSSQNFHCAM